MAPSTRQGLRTAAQAFCDALAHKESPEKIVDHFSVSEDVRALEHGLPQLAPFLGREYRGPQGIREYLQTLASLLDYDQMRFADYVVDPESAKVSVRGSATFTWRSTGQRWDEVFTYVLEFDGHGKLKVYEIWADSGAAYLASQGLLPQ